MPDAFDALTTVVLLGAALVKAAFLWLILRPPAPGPLDRRAKVLRWLLYLAVGYNLVLEFTISLVPYAVEAAVQLVLWTAIHVLYLLVIRWRSLLLRAAAAVMFAVQLVGMGNELLDALDLPEFGKGWLLGAVAATLLTIVGQHRDGRWSRGTLTAGWLSVAVYALALPLNVVLNGDPVLPVIWDVLALVSTVWIAATARELAAGESPAETAPRRGVRLALAALAVLPVVALIHPEDTPRLTYTARSHSCDDRPPFGDLQPSERDATFLCLARSTVAGMPPMFPESRSDQEILGYGRALCRTKDRAEQEAILTRAGSERPAEGADPSELVYVCPEIIGATRPELLRSSSQIEEANTAYYAEENAKCRDPWPRTKGVVQATAKYFLFVDGDPGYLVHDPDDEASAEQATDRIFDDDTTMGLASGAVLVGHIEDVVDLCLTVKAFRTAPPSRKAGWDQVREVPITSRSGKLTVPYMGDGGEVGAGAPMPNLAITGKGRYRVRVHVRVTGAGEEHLVVVFPGR
ncbi:hypothetical protein ACIBG8_04870 [Nonomuraea sp. NPDC050556]|uniref:hypothetical protein n=1 Tax=Nonomuraea sp. NPDC050556 TaxID=3364369 RepID=UPI0037B5B53A